MLKFVDVFGRREGSELSQLEVAELMGMGEQTFRRWCRRYEEEGEAGLLDRRIGKASGKRIPVDRCEEVEALYRTRYQSFTARHFHEHLVREHRFAWSYSWTRTFLQSRNLLPKPPPRRAPAHAAASCLGCAASGCIAAIRRPRARTDAARVPADISPAPSLSNPASKEQCRVGLWARPSG